MKGAETLTSDDNRIDRMLGDFDERVSRGAIDAIDAVFQNPEEIGLPDQGSIDVSGPSVGGRSGNGGKLDRDVTDDLTSGKGLIPEKSEGADDSFFRTSEAELQKRVEKRREALSPLAEGAGDVVTDVTGSDKAGNIAEGAANAPVGLASQGGAGLLLAADTATEVAGNTPGAVREYGAGEVAYAGAEVGGRVTEAILNQAQNNPYKTTGELVGGFATGAAGFKAIEKAGDVGRQASLSTKDTVKFEDITSDRAAETGELPGFDDPGASTSKAVEEVREKAADNPDAVTEKTGGETLYHGTQDDFGTDIDVGEGASELPGLFTSPDASTIALSGKGSSLSLSSIKPRLPDPAGNSDRFVGLPGDRVDSIPEGRAAQGYELRDPDTSEQVTGGLGRGEAKAAADGNDGVEVRPDQTTSGYEYLTEDAEVGTGYVKPSSTRSPELEAVFPPDSKFEKTGQVSVKVGQKKVPGTDTEIPLTGRSVPLDTYRRIDADRDPDTDLGDTPSTGGNGEVVDYDELTSETMDSRGSPEGSPTVGGGVTGATLGGISGGTAGTTSPSESSGTPKTVPTATIPPTDPTVPEYPTDPPTLPPSTQPPTDPPSTQPPTDPPSSLPPSSPPASPPGSSPPTSGDPTSVGPGSGSPGSGSPTGSPGGSGGGPPTPYGGGGGGSSRRWDFDDEEDEFDHMGRFDGYGDDWTNPVASAQEALDATLGGVDDTVAPLDRSLDDADAALEETLEGVDDQFGGGGW
ncbi:hypothetical protein [Halolamina salifodinae]|uniref:Uncharacterized protein n=1 Tax=Halolamina salifodinae TaxID=1202767 RepID=A0A8T4GYD7_9EURY|nr:hypothetical protein [Halolamina salifodinae]MBP1987242.1 hypothetical protein [Halolamina salifodinae]